MPAAKSLPPVEYLIECFSYDPETGVLTWKERPLSHFPSEQEWKRFNARFSKLAAGGVSGKYLVIGMGKTTFKAHRLIWKLISGDEPSEEIDHHNNNKLDNRAKNLRLANHSDNMCNRLRRPGQLLPGVFLDERKKNSPFGARISHKGTRYLLGYFDTQERAHATYQSARAKFHGEFSANTRPRS